jgi:hypothetical protein
MFASPNAARGRSRGRVLLVIIVVVVLVLAAVIYYASTAPVVTITQINVYAPTNVCGLNTFPIYYNGFSENFNNTTCTVTSVSTNTTGFSLSSIGVPISVAAVGNNTLTLTLNLPNNGFNGVVNLIYT